MEREMEGRNGGRKWREKTSKVEIKVTRLFLASALSRKKWKEKWREQLEGEIGGRNWREKLEGENGGRKWKLCYT